MTHTGSRVVYKGAHYTACITRAGFSVQSNRTGKGICLSLDNPQCEEWLNAFETAINDDERHFMAKAILNH